MCRKNKAALIAVPSHVLRIKLLLEASSDDSFISESIAVVERALSVERYRCCVGDSSCERTWALVSA